MYLDILFKISLFSQSYLYNHTDYRISDNVFLLQDDASSSGTDMSICRSEALFSSYKDMPGTSESLIQVSNCPSPPLITVFS